MKIACIGYMHGKGGAERQLVMLANALAQNNEVYLVALCEYNISYPVDSKVKVIDLTYAEKKAIKTISRWKELVKIYKTILPDLTIHFWLQTAYLTALLPYKIRRCIIYSERNDPGDVEYKGINGILRKIAFFRIDGFVFQTKYAQQYFSKVIQARSCVIPNPVDIDKNRYLKPCEDRKKIVITAGRLVERKNQGLLISAFSHIAGEFPDYNLSIYGDGPLKDNLLKMIKNRKMEDRITIYESTDEIYDRIYEASLFVLTSEYEGMPNVLIEAMALGTPCISTDCRPGGARAIIHSGENGYIVALNDMEALSDEMRNLLVNKTKAQTIANVAMKIRETHSQDAIYEKWQSFVKHICK